MRTMNPVLKNDVFSRERSFALDAGNTMTLSGTINKSITLVALCLLSASLTWGYLADAAIEKAPMITGLMAGSGIGALVIVLITFFKKSISPYTAPLYAVLEGVLLGSISLFMERMYPGIVIQAVLLTAGVLFFLLFAYRTGWIKVTEKFRMGVFACTGAIFLVYMIGWIMSFFGSGIPYIHESGMIGIGFSVFVVIIASMNLVLDFDFIDRASKQGLPRYMEWFSGLALLITLVWLYIEILQLLAKTRQR